MPPFHPTVPVCTVRFSMSQEAVVDDEPPVSCPLCTFHNRVTAQNCEMCAAVLAPATATCGSHPVNKEEAAASGASCAQTQSSVVTHVAAVEGGSRGGENTRDSSRNPERKRLAGPWAFLSQPAASDFRGKRRRELALDVPRKVRLSFDHNSSACATERTVCERLCEE